MNRSAQVAGKTPSGNSAKPDDSNLHVYNQREVAAYYAALEYLTPCEKKLFDEFVKPGDAILDAGVGGGRTTPYLSRIASRYVGVDYAPEMIAACRKKFPQLEFLVADATNLASLAGQTFVAVVMAFNGMDYLIPNESRRRCLEEIHRVLKKDGRLIFSSHNPRAIFPRPSWNREKIEELANRLAGTRKWLREPARVVLLGLRVAVALVRSGMESVVRCFRRIPRHAFWSGDGYMFDPAHGGLLTHYAVPERVVAELEEQRFRFVQFTGDDYPRQSWAYVTDWYYYVFQKADRSTSSPCV
jgi:SAM-dependent methyltransferase